jgi:hypothetical protein
MEKVIMKVLSAYVSRNETCFINDFEFSTKETEEKYKVGTCETDKYGSEFKGSYYVTLGDHGLLIEDIM